MKIFIQVIAVFMVGILVNINLQAQPSSLQKGTAIPRIGGKVEILKSDNGKFILALETTQIFIWDVDNAKNIYDMGWEGDAEKLTFQNDGNVVVSNNAGGVLWETKTSGWSNPSLKLMNEGNLIVFSGTQEKWTSHEVVKQLNDPNHKGDRLQTTNVLYGGHYLSSPNKQYHLKVIPEGAVLLLNHNGGTVYWNSNTGSDGGNFDALKFQSDGNLVIYNKNGNALWAANCHNKGGAHLVLQDDGNLVIYKQDGITPVWSLKNAFQQYANFGGTGWVR